MKRPPRLLAAAWLAQPFVRRSGSKSVRKRHSHSLRRDWVWDGRLLASEPRERQSRADRGGARTVALRASFRSRIRWRLLWTWAGPPREAAAATARRQGRRRQRRKLAAVTETHGPRAPIAAGTATRRCPRATAAMTTTMRLAPRRSLGVARGPTEPIPFLTRCEKHGMRKRVTKRRVQVSRTGSYAHVTYHGMRRSSTGALPAGPAWGPPRPG